jgi:DHA2 family multidrug resistance protein
MERLRETVTWTREAAVEQLNNIAAGFSQTVGLDGSQAALKTLSNLVAQQALVMAFSDVFMILAAVFFGVVLLIPLARKPQPVAPGTAGGH